MSSAHLSDVVSAFRLSDGGPSVEELFERVVGAVLEYDIHLAFIHEVVEHLDDVLVTEQTVDVCLLAHLKVQINLFKQENRNYSSTTFLIQRSLTMGKYSVPQNS